MRETYLAGYNRAMRLALVVLVVAACGGSIDGGGDDTPDPDGPVVDPPVPAGCIDNVATGDHTYTCSTLTVDARIPAACQGAGCGLILVLHGDTGNGLLMDGHVKMRELGDQHGYVVVAPTGPPFGGQFPGSTWETFNDAQLIEIVEAFRDVFRIDPKKIHVTGFSRGGFVTWRLLCDHSELFASAAPAGAGVGTNFGEPTCFTQGRKPARAIPIVFLMGRTDTSVGYQQMVSIRDAAIAEYGAAGPVNVRGDNDYRHDRWTGEAVIETFDHAYETVNDGPFGQNGQFGDANGHCIAGSTTDPYAPQYAIPCARINNQPNAFIWGEEVMAFFQAHPLP
jgi:polyhydroxybutyrate depolymerase